MVIEKPVSLYLTGIFKQKLIVTTSRSCPLSNRPSLWLNHLQINRDSSLCHVQNTGLCLEDI